MTCQCSRAPPPPPATVTCRRLLYMAITLFGTGLVMSVVILLVFNFCAGNLATCLSLLRTHGSWQIDALHAHIQCAAEQRSRTRILRFSDFKKLRFFSEMTCQKVTSRYRKFRAQSFEMSSHTSLCDHRNSFQLFIVSLVYLRTYRHLSHTVLSCIVSCECEHYVHISARGV